MPLANRSADRVLGARGCLFTFHRAAPSHIWQRLPNRAFYLDLAFLDRLLSYLKRTGWDIVTVEEATRRSQQGSDRRYVNFSVDDGYRDTFEHVVPLFRSHAVPVTLFVTTGIPDGTLPMWSAGLEEVLLERDRVVLLDRAIEVATEDQKRAAFRDIAKSWDGPAAGELYARFCALNGIDQSAMHARHAISWDMLAQLGRDPLVEIGAHTVSHARISALPEHAALGELAGSRDRLASELGLPIRHFAFPYGRSGDCGPRDFDLARRAGFSSAATTRKGLLRRGHDAYSLPRNTINGDRCSLAAMEAHLTGLSGMAARLLGRV
ncbi:MAG: polysaccharide deacetylase family protein [Xanthobacteraceae bacterium]|nr:polysaccharide deacetylase family protein [Xanthobacteraceae bacterium]